MGIVDSTVWLAYQDLTEEQQSLDNKEARTIMMMKIQNLWASSGVCTLLMTLALPRVAGAFGKSPSQSELFDQPGQMASPTDTDGGGTLFASVPEPSSLLLLGIALGLGAVVTIWKWRRQATGQKQAE